MSTGMSDPNNVKEVETCNYCGKEFCSAGDIEENQIHEGESYCDDCIFDAMRNSLESLAAEIEINKSFYELTVKERNLAWLELESLKEAQKLLMMFVKDSFATATGLPTKKTAISLMKFISKDAILQRLVNIGDYAAILQHRRK